MVESNPGCPYGDRASDPLNVQPSMEQRYVYCSVDLSVTVLIHQRRKFIDSRSSQSTHPFTVLFFPALGLPNGIDNDEPCSDVSQPRVLNEAISNDARHQAVQKNIRLRRERSFGFTTPMFTDKNSKHSTGNAEIPLKNAVFGPGHCGLQATFQGPSESEILMTHDQLIPLGPVLLALTASTPICNGYLKDIDVRWNQLTDSMDDRPKRECKDIMPRCFANNLYLVDDARLPEKYQRDDLHINVDLRKAPPRWWSSSFSGNTLRSKFQPRPTCHQRI